jgi:hypothetical protein
MTGDDGCNRYSDTVEGAHADDRSRGDLVVALADSNWRPRRSAAGLRGASTATKINEGSTARRRKESRYRYAPPELVDVAVFANIGAGSSLRRERATRAASGERLLTHIVDQNIQLTRVSWVSLTEEHISAIVSSRNPNLQYRPWIAALPHSTARNRNPDFDRKLSQPKTSARRQLICAGSNNAIRREMLDSPPST